MPKAKTIFLDRDGVINRQPAPHDYVKRWEEFEFLPGVPQAIRRLNEAGYRVLVVTNQRGIALQRMTTDDVNDIHSHMREELAKNGAHVDGIYVCPHDYGQCRCRKPDIGLFLQAERDFEIDKRASYMIGDDKSDIIAGQRYGVKGIRTCDLPDAVSRILEESP